ncbi:hypothetical protein P9112_012592 [Eukaryota sp. TZLM1-RC]
MFGILASRIGVDFNPSKCQILGRQNDFISFEGVELPFVNYDDDCNELLGTLIGYEECIAQSLKQKVEKASSELAQIQNLPLKKHINFHVDRLRFSSKINHLIGSIFPTLTARFVKQYLNKRTQLYF